MAKVGDIIEAENARWRFSGDASARFDQHVRKSVPFYDDVHELIVALSDFFLRGEATCIDLGCATGQLLRRLGEHHAGKPVRFVGIDAEADMIERARITCDGLAGVELQHGNILDADLSGSDLVIACFTLQFVPPRDRQRVFDRIYANLNWGGGLLLFEKVRAPDARFQDMMTALYADHKLRQGYSGDEVIAKSRSLKGVLEPFSTAGNLGLMERAGFVDVMSVFKYVCFEGFLAIK